MFRGGSRFLVRMALFGILAVGASDLANARDTSGTTIGTKQATIAPPLTLSVHPSDSDPAEPIRISVSRDADLVGPQRFASRSSLASTGMSVSILDRPAPAIRRQSRVLFGSAPLALARVSSSFGYRWHPLEGGRRFHAGVDLAAPSGTSVYAAAAGQVAIAGNTGGYGLLVELEHGSGYETRYGHLSRLNVVPGQTVQTGELIGFVGSTGNSTGPHLHYEKRINGVPVDPLSR